MIGGIREGLRRRARSFDHALAGLRYVLETQPNAWIHALLSGLSIILGVWLEVPRRDWALLVIAIGIVWVAELANTALEAVVDMTMPRPHPKAKAAKDVAAAAVLIGAASSALIGLLVLGPPLWRMVMR